MEILEQISQNLQAGKAKIVKQLVQQAIDEGIPTQKILNEGPIAAGCSKEEIKRLAKRLVNERTLTSTGLSFAAGLPGGIAMAGTIPADTIQFYGIALRLAQEISYLYGADD